jgi:hypothetical protein
VACESAQAFEDPIALRGDHSHVIRPDDRDDERYRRVCDALLAPAGHRHVYEIDSYNTSIEVQPLALEKQTLTAQYGTPVRRERTVVSDNHARVTRAVTFSRSNRCMDLFRFKYRTKSNGFAKPRIDVQPRGPISPYRRTARLPTGLTASALSC